MNAASIETEPDLDDVEDRVPEALIQHAVRCWDAEVENSRQLATRMNLLVPGVLAVLGFGVFRLGWVAEERHTLRHWPLEWVMRVLIVSALMLLFRALWLLLVLRLRSVRKRGPAVKLRLPAEILERLGRAGAQRATQAAFWGTYRAFLEMQKRNRRQEAKIGRGQQCLFLALAFLISALAGYNIFGSG